MLYFFHHYELPVILQHVQLQQLLLRTHRGMAGMMGLAGIAALASNAAYHDAGTGTQPPPPTVQSTTQTVHDTVQSTTQTTPSVSTVHTNTTHTGDVLTSRTPETTTAGTNTPVRSEDMPSPVRIDKDAPVSEGDIRIEDVARRNSGPKIDTRESSPEIDSPMSAGARVESTLDRRRDEDSFHDHLLEGSGDVARQAPRASPEADDLD